MKTIDLRSDTVTRPTAAMRAAMAAAEVGDDVYGEDPTVNRLQALAAERLGMEAAIFLPSGTMANQAALAALTRHGDAVLTSTDCHILRHESGAAAALSGLQLLPIGSGGFFSAADLRQALPPPDHHFAPVTTIAVENTHNLSGGRVFPFADLRELIAAAGERRLKVHLDGARLWNAVVASGIAARQWAEGVDTVSFCLSKGLGAPVGSLVCGSAAVIDRVHRVRKMLGGGMRQAGILAAAGLHALKHHVERLADDHRNAERLARGLTAVGFRVEPWPETNIVRFRVADAGHLAGALRERGVLVSALDGRTLRAVTHLDAAAEDIDDVLGRIGEALGGQRI
jgi:threonine aldolase